MLDDLTNRPTCGRCGYARESGDPCPCDFNRPRDVRDALVPPSPVADQPPPVESDGPAVWPLVIGDMHARDRIGRARYGTPLRAFNGRDALVDAYQEALDLAVYLRQAIAERDARARASRPLGILDRVRLAFAVLRGMR